MVRLHVEDVEFGLEGCGHQLVHIDVLTIELKSADAVLKVGVPSQAIGLQVKDLNVTVVVASSEDTLFLIVCITEASSPAVRLNRFVGTRFK